MARGVLSYWGTYSVNEAEKTFTLNIERSSYPKQNGTQARRVVQSLTDDELKFGVPARLAGGQNDLAWKRIR